MKLVFFCLLTLVLATSFDLKIEPSISLELNDNNVYIPIEYSGNSGEVTFNIKGLPDGLVIRNNVIAGKTDSKNGYFPILIDARDAKGNTASKICVLKVGSKSSSISSNSGSSTSTINSSNSGASSISIQGITGNADTSGFTSSTSIILSTILNEVDSQSQNSFQSPSGLSQNARSGSNNGLGLTSNSGLPLTTFDFISSLQNTPSSTSSSSTQRTVTQSTTARSSLPSDLDSLLDQLAPRQQTKVDSTYLSTRYQPFPTAAVVPNTTPNLIRSSQAPKSQANRNIITEDDIKTTAIFERQLNANKAIANLLDIVDQLRANVKAAENDMQILQSQLQNSISFQRNTQAKITAAENKVSRLKEAIKNMQGKLTTLNQQLTQLKNSFKDTSRTITTQQSSIQNINTQIDKLNKKLKQLNGLIAAASQNLKKVQSDIENTLRMIQDFKIQLEKKKKQVADVDSLIDDEVRKGRNIDVEIQDLKKKLNAAIDRKVRSEREELRLRNLKANAPTQIAKIQDDIRNKEREVEDLQKKKGTILDSIKNLNSETDTATTQLDSYQMKLKQITTEITVVNGNKSDFDKAIEQKNREIAEGEKTLQFLNNELEPYEQGLAAAYREGNQANTAVNVAQQNMAAITSRWEQDNQKLQSAIINLEKARSEKQLADLAMEQLLQQRSSALPYSIVPNGNGYTNPGSPLGNNPSGSPLGPYPTSSSEVYNSLITSSTTTRSSSTAQYPFSLYRNVQSISNLAPYLGINGNILPGFYQGGSGITYNGSFNCGRNLSQSYEGTIRSVGNNALKISLGNGQTVLGAIGSCTSGFAPQPNYTPKVGDRITFYGDMLGDGAYSISSLNCYTK